MADRFYSVGVGEQTEDKVTEGATTSGEVIELRIEHDAAGMNKLAVLNGLDAIRNAIVKDTYPPA